MRPDMTDFYIHKHPYTMEDQFIDGDDMIHVLNFSYDGLLGVSTLTHAMNITGLAASSDGQAKGFFSSGANLSGILSVPGTITETKATALKTAWGNAFALNNLTGNAGGVAVLEGGAEFKPVSVNPKDAQMLETRAFNVVDICRFFGVHPAKAFDMSSSAYASAESYQLGYITDTMTPLARKIDNEVNRKLYRPSQRKKTKTLLRVREMRSADLESLKNYYTGMFQLGVYSPNDICREMNLPLDAEGDKRYVQVNLAELGKEPTPDQNKNTNVVKDNSNGE
jgi:HK97 family phage portal protein